MCEQQRMVIIPGYYEIAVSKFCAGDENHSILKGLALGKYGLMPARSGFFYLLFIKNVAGRGQLGGKDNESVKKKRRHESAQQDE